METRLDKCFDQNGTRTTTSNEIIDINWKLET